MEVIQILGVSYRDDNLFPLLASVTLTHSLRSRIFKLDLECHEVYHW